MQLVLREVEQNSWVLGRHLLVLQAVKGCINLLLDDVASKVFVRYTQRVSLPHVANLMNELPYQLGEGCLFTHLLDARVHNLRKGVFVKVNAGLDHPSNLSGLAPVKYRFVKNDFAELFFR